MPVRPFPWKYFNLVVLVLFLGCNALVRVKENQISDDTRMLALVQGVRFDPYDKRVRGWIRLAMAFCLIQVPSANELVLFGLGKMPSARVWVPPVLHAQVPKMILAVLGAG